MWILLRRFSRPTDSDVHWECVGMTVGREQERCTTTQNQLENYFLRQVRASHPGGRALGLMS